MQWNELVDAAQSTGWTIYLGTADASGRPHVSVVGPAYTEGHIWFATRKTSKKFQNLRENPFVGFHTSIATGGSGELAAWGTATIHESDEARRPIWDSGIFTYDLAGFFGSVDNDAMAFIECAIESARFRGADFIADRYPER